ncbi:MAG TPA: non-canonical purine NTP pyrophosphatase [Longimicrobiales bacterium]|nr:non-canonical purine NTP pyrophosphatase [Longimicrobiales bacterium]
MATRSAHKLAEIQRILPGLRLDSLREAGVEPAPEEDALEGEATFLGNALAKARYFARRTGRVVLADDSGLCVDALGGRPGVRTKRLAVDEGAVDAPDDEANNRVLLRLLDGVPAADRGAHYMCAAALAGSDGGVRAALGVCRGVIGEAPRGQGGFGYDPLFRLPDGRAMAELDEAAKDAVSHRGRAFRALAANLGLAG